MGELKGTGRLISQVGPARIKWGIEKGNRQRKTKEGTESAFSGWGV